MLFDKTSYGNKGSFKYDIEYRYKSEAFPSPLNIKRPQLIGFTKFFNNNEYINFLVNDKKLLKNKMKYVIRLKVYLFVTLLKKILIVTGV